MVFRYMVPLKPVVDILYFVFCRLGWTISISFRYINYKNETFIKFCVMYLLINR